MEREVATLLHMESINDSGCHFLPQPLVSVVSFPTSAQESEKISPSVLD